MNSLRTSRAISRLNKPLSGSSSVQRPAGISPAGSRAAQASAVAMTSRVLAALKFRTSFKSTGLLRSSKSFCVGLLTSLVALLSTFLSARVVFAAATLRYNFECNRVKREFRAQIKPAINVAERLPYVTLLNYGY